jgi:hypothetical protein
MRQQWRKPDGRPVGLINGLIMKHLLKRESWTTALDLAKERAKGSPPEKKHHEYERTTHSCSG